MSRCSMCGGTGRTEPTVLDRLDLAETGVMDLQCLACDGTGQTTLTPPPGLWGDRELFDRLHDRWTSLRYGTRSGPEVPA